MDGSQKLPQRLLGTIRDRLARNASIARTGLGVAAWMRYVTGIHEHGHGIDLRDPLASRLRAVAEASANAPARLVNGLLIVREVFGDDPPRNEQLRAVLTEHLVSLFRDGAREAVRQCNLAFSGE